MFCCSKEVSKGERTENEEGKKMDYLLVESIPHSSTAYVNALGEGPQYQERGAKAVVKPGRRRTGVERSHTPSAIARPPAR